MMMVTAQRLVQMCIRDREMVEITKQDYENALNVLPPRNWHTRNNIEEFCSREMYSGTYTCLLYTS